MGCVSLTAGWMPVLLLSDAVTLVGIVAVFALALVFMVGALVFVQVQKVPAPAATAPAPFAWPAGLKAVRAPRKGAHYHPPIEIDVPTKHVDAVIGALDAAGWRVQETGEVVATDEDEEALTTLLVEMPATPHPSAAVGTGEEIR